MVWTIGIATLFAVLFALVAIARDAHTALDIVLGVQSPLGGKGVGAPKSAGGVGVMLALFGYVLVPSIIGLVVSIVFDSFVRADITRRLEVLERDPTRRNPR